MSELKSFESERIYWAVVEVEQVTGDIDILHLDDNLFYIKSEADKVIAHHKYKRCLWTAMWCKSKSEIYNEFAADASEYMPSYEARFRRKAVLYQKWDMRWWQLAEKFKEGNDE